MMTPETVDHAAINRLVDKFEDIAENERNYAVVAASALFLADLIAGADMRDKEQFVDALAKSIKGYLRLAIKNKRKHDA